MERKGFIGGSDAAVILGISRWKTPVDLALEKLGKAEPFQGNRFTEAGNMLEETIARWYEKETGNKIRNSSIVYKHPKYPYIKGQIDRLIEKQPAFLECKSADRFTAHMWGESGSNDVPDEYFVQVQHYLMLNNFEWCDMAVLIGGNDFRIYHIEPDKELQNIILEKELEFWDLISRGLLPKPITGTDVSKIYPRHADTSITATAELMEVVERIGELASRKKEMDKELDKHNTIVMEFMAENAVLVNADGEKLFQYKLQNVAGFDENGLKTEYPEIWQKCQSEVLDEKLVKKEHPEIYDKYKNKRRVLR
jgi:putative phage-type endonuclease